MTIPTYFQCLSGTSLPLEPTVPLGIQKVQKFFEVPPVSNRCWYPPILKVLPRASSLLELTVRLGIQKIESTFGCHQHQTDDNTNLFPVFCQRKVYLWNPPCPWGYRRFKNSLNSRQYQSDVDTDLSCACHHIMRLPRHFPAPIKTATNIVVGIHHPAPSVILLESLSYTRPLHACKIVPNRCWYPPISRVLSGTSLPLEPTVPLGIQKIKRVLWSPTSINQMLIPTRFKRPTRWLVKKAEGFSKEPRELRTTAQGYGNWGKKATWCLRWLFYLLYRV